MVSYETHEFQKGKEYGVESFIIPPSLFEIRKPFTSIEITYFGLNKSK